MSEELTRVGEGLFKLARRGYDREEVDAYVAQLHRQIHELQDRSTPDGAVRHALDRVGEEVSGILQSSHATAADVIAAAEHEAAEHKRQASEHAAEIVAIAERRVHELDLDTDRIWAERERIVADARDLARQLQGVADLAAERFPSDPGNHQAPSDPGVGFATRGPGFDELNASN
jgi:DivIVA domain-containing protein